MNTFEVTLRRNLVKYAVQRQIFCQATEQVLDMRRAVLVEVSHPENGKATLILSGDAYDERIAPKLAQFLANGLTVEIHDGRGLFSRSAAKQESGWKLYEPVDSASEVS